MTYIMILQSGLGREVLTVTFGDPVATSLKTSFQGWTPLQTATGSLHPSRTPMSNCATPRFTMAYIMILHSELGREVLTVTFGDPVATSLKTSFQGWTPLQTATGSLHPSRTR